MNNLQGINLHDSAVEESLGAGHEQQVRHGGATSRRPEHRDARRVPTERRDVLLDPAERQLLVQQPEVTCRAEKSVKLSPQKGSDGLQFQDLLTVLHPLVASVEEPHHVESVVHGNYDDVTERAEQRGVVAGQRHRANVERAAVDPHLQQGIC